MRGRRYVRLAPALAVLVLAGLVQAAPLASFLVEPASPTTNDRVRFDATPSRGGPLIRYDWDFDGDGLFDASSASAQMPHFFDLPGDYPVTLRVEDASGAQARFSQTVTVEAAPVTSRRTFETALGADRVLAGGTVTVTVTVRVDQPASGLGLVERPPAGWRARPLEDGGAIFKREGETLQWLWAESLEPGRLLTVRYGLSVAETAPRGRYELEGEISSFGVRKFRLPVYSLAGLEVF